MRTTMIAVVVAVVLAIPALATAQPQCGVTATSGQTKIFGCLDAPAAGTVVSASQPLPMSGWAISLYTDMQPEDLTVYMSTGADTGGAYRILAKSEYDVRMRGLRPDVTAHFRHYGPLTTDHWGYLVVLHAGVLQVGDTVLALRWIDTSLAPWLSIGANYQQTQLTVVP